MSEPVCPYCRMPFDEGLSHSERIFCTACGMPHHEDCYRENGGCTVFGCKCAPADDPKLQVSQSDLSAITVPVQQYAGFPQQNIPQQNVPQQNTSAQPYPPSLYGGPLGLSQAAAPAPAQMQAAAILDPSTFLLPMDGRIKAGQPLLFLVYFLGALGVLQFL